jgi:phage regulator Rha-like protein
VPTENPLVPVERVELGILEIRGRKVIVDADLAAIYGVPTKQLNQAIKRNAERFPADFMFRLTPEEASAWQRLRSQIVTLKRGQHLKYLPYAFTEHGAIMAATVLNSPKAVQMSLFVVRAFVKMRETLASHAELAEKLDELESKLSARLDDHEKAILHLLRQVKNIVSPAYKRKRQIGFHVQERRAKYRVTRRPL